MKKPFAGAYAPSTLGSFLRAFTFGHVRQLDATAWRWLVSLAAQARIVAGIDEYAVVDIDDTIKEVHRYQKQGSGYGYSGIRGLNALLGIVSTPTAAPIIIGSRLRKGATGSPRGAKRFVADILTTVKRLRSTTITGPVLLRADSAFYGHAVVSAAHHAGTKVSITARMDPAVKRAIGTISGDAWTTIQYTNAILDETTGKWVSRSRKSPRSRSPLSAAGKRPNMFRVVSWCVGSQNSTRERTRDS
jgi:hypothetical protein